MRVSGQSVLNARRDSSSEVMDKIVISIQKESRCKYHAARVGCVLIALAAIACFVYAGIHYGYLNKH